MVSNNRCSRLRRSFQYKLPDVLSYGLEKMNTRMRNYPFVKQVHAACCDDKLTCKNALSFLLIFLLLIQVLSLRRSQQSRDILLCERPSGHTVNSVPAKKDHFHVLHTRRFLEEQTCDGHMCTRHIYIYGFSLKHLGSFNMTECLYVGRRLLVFDASCRGQKWLRGSCAKMQMECRALAVSSIWKWTIF